MGVFVTSEQRLVTSEETFFTTSEAIFVTSIFVASREISATSERILVYEFVCNDFVGTSSEQKYHLDSNAHKILLATVASRPFCINIDRMTWTNSFVLRVQIYAVSAF